MAQLEIGRTVFKVAIRKTVEKLKVVYLLTTM